MSDNEFRFDSAYAELARVTHDAITGSGPVLSPEPESPSSRIAVLNELEAIIAHPIVDARAVDLRCIPRGWATPLRDAFRATYHLRGAFAPVPIRIRAKEKYGVLRFDVFVTGDQQANMELHAISEWAKNVTRYRCAGTGKPGKITRNGWVIPLSEELEALMLTDREEFRARLRMYPSLLRQ